MSNPGLVKSRAGVYVTKEETAGTTPAGAHWGSFASTIVEDPFIASRREKVEHDDVGSDQKGTIKTETGSVHPLTLNCKPIFLKEILESVLGKSSETTADSRVITTLSPGDFCPSYSVQIERDGTKTAGNAQRKRLKGFKVGDAEISVSKDDVLLVNLTGEGKDVENITTALTSGEINALPDKNYLHFTGITLEVKDPTSSDWTDVTTACMNIALAISRGITQTPGLSKIPHSINEDKSATSFEFTIFDYHTLIYSLFMAAAAEQRIDMRLTIANGTDETVIFLFEDAFMDELNPALNENYVTFNPKFENIKITSVTVNRPVSQQSQQSGQRSSSSTPPPEERAGS